MCHLRSSLLLFLFFFRNAILFQVKTLAEWKLDRFFVFRRCRCRRRFCRHHLSTPEGCGSGASSPACGATRVFFEIDIFPHRPSARWVGERRGGEHSASQPCLFTEPPPSRPVLPMWPLCVTTEGWVDEHLEQDGEVCIHPPLQRLHRHIFCMEQRPRRRLPDTGSERSRKRVLPPYIVEKTVFSTKSTVFDAWGCEKLTRCHADFSCTRIDCLFFQRRRRGSLQYLPMVSRNPKRVFPKRSAKHPCNTCQSPAMFHNAPQKLRLTRDSHPRVFHIGPQ